jgi:hypothetical protein
VKHGNDTKEEEKNTNMRQKKKEKIIKHTYLQVFKVLFRLGSILALFKRRPLHMTWLGCRRNEGFHSSVLYHVECVLQITKETDDTHIYLVWIMLFVIR